MQHIMKYISKLLVLFAIITMATACKDDIDEVNNPLSVTTPAVSAIKGTSAAVTSMATGSHITYRGICFSQSSNPTVDDYKVMAFQQKMSVTITGLQPNTTYYVRAFVQSSFETVYSVPQQQLLLIPRTTHRPVVLPICSVSAFMTPASYGTLHPTTITSLVPTVLQQSLRI